MRQCAHAWLSLSEAAEKAKIELSGVFSTTRLGSVAFWPFFVSCFVSVFVLCKSLFLLLRISLPFIAMDEEGSPLHLEEELTRGEFEGLCAKLLGAAKRSRGEGTEGRGSKLQRLG